MIAAVAEQQLTIDELAAASKVASRTIRFYQSRGALMPPAIKGRVAYYGQPHVERLKLIAQLSAVPAETTSVPPLPAAPSRTC